MNNCNIIHAYVIDGVTGPENIASHWKQHFDKLLNIYLNFDNSLKADMLSNFDNIEHDLPPCLFRPKVFLKLLVN